MSQISRLKRPLKETPFFTHDSYELLGSQGGRSRGLGLDHRQGGNGLTLQRAERSEHNFVLISHSVLKEFTGKTIITSDHALKLESVPEWIVIVGSGYIGLEFSDVYTALGSEITPAQDGKPVTIELIDVKTKEPKDTLEELLCVSAKIKRDGSSKFRCFLPQSTLVISEIDSSVATPLQMTLKVRENH